MLLGLCAGFRGNRSYSGWPTAAEKQLPGASMAKRRVTFKILFLLVCISSAASASTISPQPSLASPPLCARCAAGSSGPCQGAVNVCWDYFNANTQQCPPGSVACTCPPCSPGTSGPCVSASDSSSAACTAYAADTLLCPQGYFECFSDTGEAPSATITPSITLTISLSPSQSVSSIGSRSITRTISFTRTTAASQSSTESPSASPAPMCKRCSSGTSGKCQQADGACWALQPIYETPSASPSTGHQIITLSAGTCPSSSVQCYCPPCSDGSSAPCHFSDGTCARYVFGTSMCPYGSFECWKDTIIMGPSTPSRTPYQSNSPSHTSGLSVTSTPSQTDAHNASARTDLAASQESSILFGGPAGIVALGFGIGAFVLAIGVLGFFCWRKHHKKRRSRDGISPRTSRRDARRQSSQQNNKRNSHHPSDIVPILTSPGASSAGV